MKNISKSDIDLKLSKTKYDPDNNSHLNPNIDDCKICNEKSCIKVCPANVYSWDEATEKPIINFENCLECGACRIACNKKSLNWVYPKGGKGVTIKHG